MIDQHRVLGLILARGGSKGLPRKNVRMLGGKPLVAWPITAATASRCIDRTIVSTDDEEIAAASRSAGADVPFMRPAELASDTASSMDAVRHVLTTLAEMKDVYDYVVLLEPTSPLTEPADVDEALERLHAARAHADSIVGIAQLEASHPEYSIRMRADGVIQPYAAPAFSALKRRQDIDELYYLEGSLYISDVQVFLQKGSFYHERTMGYRVPRWKAFEVDNLVDFICIEALLSRRPELQGLD